MCNNYLLETAIKMSIRFSMKSWNKLKMIHMIVYIKSGLVLKEIEIYLPQKIKNRTSSITSCSNCDICKNYMISIFDCTVACFIRGQLNCESINIKQIPHS